MYRKHVCMYFSKWKCNVRMHKKTYIFVIHGCKNCHWFINLMFYTLENGTKIFADHENLGKNFLILKIYWVFMEIWGKYHFPIMAPTKWPPFWPEGEIDVAPYPKTLTMTKGMSVPSFMLVPQNARFFSHIAWTNGGMSTAGKGETWHGTNFIKIIKDVFIFRIYWNLCKRRRPNSQWSNPTCRLS